MPLRAKSHAERDGPGGRKLLEGDELRHAKSLLEYGSLYKQRVCVTFECETHLEYLKEFLYQNGVRRYVQVPFASRKEVYYHFNHADDIRVLFTAMDSYKTALSHAQDDGIPERTLNVVERQ